MKRYDGILLCSDYDHTLSSCDYHGPWEGDFMLNAIPKSNIDAIEEFVARGGTFVVVSGRNPDEVASLYGRIGMQELFVASNGTAVYSARTLRPVFSQTMDDGCKDVLRYLVQTQAEMDFFRITDNDFVFRYWEKGDDLETALAAPALPIYKIIVESHCGDWEEQVRRSRRFCEVAAERFGDRYKIEMSSPITVEICPKGSDKWYALRRLIGMLEQQRGERFRRVVCVGDNQNDYLMVKNADYGVAVGNAIPSLKAVAKSVTVRSSEGAIAAVIRALSE